MLFYIRKSVSIGPFRFNLSKSGIGVSAGVRGLRIGTGPRGNYIHVGRGGLYYRASLGAKARAIAQRREVPSPTTKSTVAMHEVEIGDILEMNDSDAKEMLEQINEKLRISPASPFVVAVTLAAVIFARIEVPHLFWVAAILTTIGILATLLTWRWDRIRRSVVLLYDLEADAQQAFENLTKAFDRISTARAKWVIGAQGLQTDWKRNAGASQEVKRQTAVFGYKTPAVIKTNISVPCILGGRQNLYFFPDLLLVTEGRSVAGIDYRNVGIAWRTTPFIEYGSVPQDAQIIRHTWRYVNKKGGPDRRFKNNRQLPVMRYQELYIRSGSGLNKLFHLSRDESREDLKSTIERMGQRNRA